MNIKVITDNKIRLRENVAFLEHGFREDNDGDVTGTVSIRYRPCGDENVQTLLAKVPVQLKIYGFNEPDKYECFEYKDECTQGSVFTRTHTGN